MVSILSFWSAPAERSGDGAFDLSLHPGHSAISKAPSPLRSAGAPQISTCAHRKPLFLFSGRNGFHVRQSTDGNAARPRDLVNAQGLQHLDESFHFLFITGSLHHDLLVRDVDDLGAKNADQIQHFLSLQSSFGIHGNQRHFALDVWPRRDILDLTHTGEPRALFADLIDRAIVATRDDRDPRPLRVKRSAHRNRFDIESTRAEQPDDARKLAWLISNDNGKGVVHCQFSIANCRFENRYFRTNSQLPIGNWQSAMLRLLRSEKSCPARWLPRARWERRFLPFPRRHQLLRRHHERAPFPA